MSQIRTLAIALLFVLNLVPGSTKLIAQTQGDPDAAIDRAIELSRFEENGDTQALYRLMHPDSKAIVPFEAVDGWYRNDFFPLQPRTITEVISIDFVSWTWDVNGQVYENTAQITFIQPFGPSGATTDSQESIRLVEHNGDWKWFFGRSVEFVNQQIQKYPQEQPNQVVRTERTNSQSVPREDRTTVVRTERRSNSGALNRQVTTVPGLLDSDQPRECTLVELYPGYPLYRGNITGVMGHWGGLGDFQCLETLEEDFPNFDKSSEDQANLKAARELEIAGEPHLWTWENWLQIEAKRGLQPSCYSCLLLDESTQPIMPSLLPDPQDPRIQIGLLGSEQSLRRILLDHDVEGGFLGLLDFFDYEPYELRAIAYSYDTSGNSEEIYSRYIEIFTWAVSALGDALPSPPIYSAGSSEYMAWVLWETGGYTMVPNNAHPSDQIFLLSASVYSVDNWTTDSGDSFLHGQLERGIQEWIDLGYPDTLTEYLREMGYFSG